MFQKKRLSRSALFIQARLQFKKVFGQVLVVFQERPEVLLLGFARRVLTG
jgi:hypothetical protein